MFFYPKSDQRSTYNSRTGQRRREDGRWGIKEWINGLYYAVSCPELSFDPFAYSSLGCLGQHLVKEPNSSRDPSLPNTSSSLLIFWCMSSLTSGLLMFMLEKLSSIFSCASMIGAVRPLLPEPCMHMDIQRMCDWIFVELDFSALSEFIPGRANRQWSTQLNN